MRGLLRSFGHGATIILSVLELEREDGYPRTAVDIIARGHVKRNVIKYANGSLQKSLRTVLSCEMVGNELPAVL